MSLLVSILLVAVVTSMACSLPGVFLVLRGSTMVSDAITHTVLLGIVLSFFIVKDLSSPLLLLGAALFGIITVWLIESLHRTKIVSLDASIGIIFPFLFSIAIVLINLFASQIHLDTDAVLTGVIGFTPFVRFHMFGIDLGPQALWKMIAILCINITFISIYYRQLKVATFDPDYAESIGINTTFIHYLLMTIISLTAVATFEVAGSVLVVGFMVGPGLASYLLFNKLKYIFVSTILLSIINSTIGVLAAYYLDTTFNGMISVITGLTA